MKNLSNINYKSIDNNKQRYPTVGDYFKSKNGWDFRVSKMKADYEFLVFIHELTEWYLTQKRGISEPSITKFDVMFEKEREEGKHSIDKEPGFDKRAPYLKEHTFATKIEKLLAKELGVNWSEYDRTVMEL